MPKSPESFPPNPSDTPTVKANGAPTQPVIADTRESPERDNKDKDVRGARSSGATDRSQQTSIGQRKGQYLVAARRTSGLQVMGLQPLQFSLIEQTLRASPDIEVVGTVGPRNSLGALADGMSDVPSVLVVKMTDQKAGVLHQQAQGRLIVERDHALTMADTVFHRPTMVACSMPTSGPALQISLTVLGQNGTPLADAQVYLFGSMLPASATSDASGLASLTMYGETPQSIKGLYIKPKSDYWSYYQVDPELDPEGVNQVSMRALSDWPTLANFPQQQAFGWGQKVMRLDRLPENFRGQGVRIAVIDSGADNGHDDLKKIRFGIDIINKKTTPDSWNQDLISHGSHCAGVIAGADNGIGIRGFAPDAEVHVCKLFPGGQVSQLIDALEYCIEKQVDVVNLSLGGAEPSEALEQQLLRARQAGIACIVAAGNAGGPVQYPASSPSVLAVAAIGKLNEFPQDSYHTQTLTQLVDANGFFSPKFTCYGPQIAVCAPGVAITSSVPGNNYAAWDGTSMAAPHITGLAALVLAHHPDFQSAFKVRNAARVERLFQVIKTSAQPINFGDQGRTGFGLPDVLVAVGLQAPMGMPIGMMQQAFARSQQMPGQPPVSAFFGGGMAQHNPFTPASFNFQTVQSQQMAQPGWFGTPLGQYNPMAGSPQLSTASFDPVFGTYLSAQSSMPFGYGPGQSQFGRALW